MKQSAATSFIDPMKARLVESLPTGHWIYELKFDGYRALAFKTAKEVRLISRNRIEFKYPQLANALKLLSAQDVIIDGEITALDQDGRSSFQLLLQRELGWVQGFVEGTVSEASGVSTTATICAEASNFAQPRGPVSTTVKASSDKSSTRDAKAPRTDS